MIALADVFTIAAVEPWFTNVGAVGGLLGAGVGVLGGGIYGPLVGICAPLGKAKTFVMGYHWLMLILGVGLVLAGLFGLLQGQPTQVWLALLMPGALLAFLMAMFTPMVRARYRQAEYRRVDAESFRSA